MKKVVYVLLVTQQDEGGVRVGIGPIHWDRIDAGRDKRALEARGMLVQVVEKEVRGDPPEMRTGTHGD